MLCALCEQGLTLPKCSHSFTHSVEETHGFTFLHHFFQAKLEQREEEKVAYFLPTVDSSWNLSKQFFSEQANHIVFQGDHAVLSVNGDARTPDVYKALNGYRVV